jgi:hypothetical protein
MESANNTTVRRKDAKGRKQVVITDNVVSRESSIASDESELSVVIEAITIWS